MWLLLFEECDGAVGANSWGTHGSDWQTNPKRCPLWLKYIRAELGELNPDWPADEVEAVMYAARYYAFRRMRAMVDEVGGEVNFRRLLQATLERQGFTVEEVMAFDMSKPLFNRRT